jgi:hypothetical protein
VPAQRATRSSIEGGTASVPVQAPSPVRAPVPSTHRPASTTSSAAAGVVLAKPGTFCSRPGLIGYTSHGTRMICSVTNPAGKPYPGGQARWHAY